MTISYNWLMDYLPELAEESKPDPERLSEILTGIGLEVESLEEYQQIPGGLKDLIIGKIGEVKPHPNADRLKLTWVDIGASSPLQIVCGAPNVAEGLKVVVAPVGATLYSANGEAITMKKAKIRGQLSYGMICAEDEIGLGDSHEGIMSLDGNAQPGMKASDYFGVKGDWVYEIGLTPNRMDAMSHIGVARDVCAKLSRDTARHWTAQLASVDAFKAEGIGNEVKVEIENEAACSRYSGVVLSDIKVDESPSWLKERLMSVGVRPINNVVDITNYVLHECGQPLHAFDMEAVKGRQIKVKNLAEGTPFVTLDKETHKLQAADLMICNEEEPMCIAGVFGGLYSGVTEKTTTIFLESACFDSVGVRRTSLHHGLRTGAAARFEKGVDISGVIYALKRAALLMTELCGAHIASDLVDCYPHPPEKTIIHLEKDYLNKLSGKAFTLKQVENILTDLRFELIDRSDTEIRVAVPFNKPDMTVAADLVEEIMRIDGYENIEIPTHIRIAPSLRNADTDREQQKEKIAAYLSDNGFYEVMTNSITNSRYYGAGQPLVRLMNNLSRELDVMRPSLLETGLEAVAYNLNRKQEEVHFFEIGKVYAPEGTTEKSMLALWSSGNKFPIGWLRKTEQTDPYFLKGHLQNLLIRLGLSKRQLSFVPVTKGYLENSIAIRMKGASIGQLGTVPFSTLKRFGIKQAVWYVEIDLAALEKYNQDQAIIFKPIPKFPVIKRDLALILNKEVQFSEVENVAEEINTRILEEIKLFDVFEGSKLGADKKSYAVSFIFRHPKKTLTDFEIDKVMTKLIRSFEKQLGAEIRS